MAENGRRLQDRITDLILARGLTPGSALPTEPQLMAALGASRNSVREALRALHTLGIVEIRHGYGTFVGHAPITAFAPGLLFQARQSLRGDASVLSDLVEIRQILEVALIARVAERVDEEFLAELDAAVDQMSTGDLAEADQRFHELLYRRMDNAVAAQLISLFWSVYHRVEAELEPPLPDPAEISQGHRQIVAALRSGDPAAAQATMVGHFADITARVARLTTDRDRQPD